MARRNPKSSNSRSKKTHPGSSIQDAKKVSGKGDFGVPESDVVERTYTSMNTKLSDRGAAPVRSGSDDSRTGGVGGNSSGAGSSSGGDLDTDIVGIGTGVGVATSGKVHEPPGPDDATGTSRDFASGPPAQRAKLLSAYPDIGGSTVQPADESPTTPLGADAETNPDAGNDASVGEVSSDEATGRNDAAE